MKLEQSNAPLKIMLTGKNGQVGWELQRTLTPQGEVIALGREELDLTDIEQIRVKVNDINPDIIINAAAYTAVDKAEEQPELARKVNGIAPGILAEEAKKINALLVHYSTDYVFDGTKNEPYTEEDIPNPINVYGKTKLEGENAIQAIGVPYFIFRTSWVYGMRRKNFLLTILRLALEQEQLKIINDQIGSPTWSRFIAEVTSLVLTQTYLLLTSSINSFNNLSGIYHLSANGSTSWYEFAKLIVESCAELSNYSSALKVKNIEPISTTEYSTNATRPLNSALSNSKIIETFKLRTPEWDKMLNLVLDT